MRMLGDTDIETCERFKTGDAGNPGKLFHEPCRAQNYAQWGDLPCSCLSSCVSHEVQRQENSGGDLGNRILGYLHLQTWREFRKLASAAAVRLPDGGYGIGTTPGIAALRETVSQTQVS